MARTKGSANLAASLEILAEAPVDARTVVAAESDLTVAANFPYAYVGMPVYVKATQKMYVLTATPVTTASNWKEVGSGGSSLPSGGTTGQVLTKGSATDYDVAWYTPYYYEYDGVTLSKPNFTYNDPDLVEDGKTKVFHSIWLANTSTGQNSALPDTDIVNYDRNYYVEMTKSIDGLAFVQRCRKFYTIAGTNYCKQYERRCTGSGSSWTFSDWIESTANTSKFYSSDDTAFTDIADGDYIPVYDTSDSTKKKSLWSNIKSLLKTYFDTLYQGRLTAGSNITMSGNTINATLVRDNYSTTEQAIGKWIDNKPLYQKTINCGALPNATEKKTSTGLSSSTHRIRSIRGYAYRSDNGSVIPLPNAASNYLATVATITSGTYYISLSCTTDFTKYTESYVTIQYTKTTD